MSTTLSTAPQNSTGGRDQATRTASPAFVEFSPFPMSASHRRTWMPRADGQHPALV